ncbi:hypothetical protein ACOYQJ_04835, partial [Primorskyibacter sp. 2E233]
GFSDLDYVRFWDSTPGTDGGHWEINGVAVSGTYFDISPSDLGSIVYVAGPNGGSNPITIEAFDDSGASSGDLNVTINVSAPANSAPSLTGPSSQSLQPGQSVSGDQLVSSVSDPDGFSDLDYVRFWDSTPGTDGGHWEINGVAVSGTYFDISPSDLGSIVYVAGPNTGANEITIEAFDDSGASSGDLNVVIIGSGDVSQGDDGATEPVENSHIPLPNIYAPFSDFVRGQYINQPLHTHTYIVSPSYEEGSGYWSIDFGGGFGEEVVAPFNGTIVHIEGGHEEQSSKYNPIAQPGSDHFWLHDVGWYILDDSPRRLGNTVTIQSADDPNLYVTYAHLSMASVALLYEGMPVVGGETVVGELGRTGIQISTQGPEEMAHVHVMIGTSLNYQSKTVTADSSLNGNPSSFFYFVDSNGDGFDATDHNSPGISGLDGIGGAEVSFSVIGSFEPDILIGPFGNTYFSGQDGDDRFLVSGGGNYVSGGNGLDTVSYAGVASGVGIRLDGTPGWRGAVGDVMHSIENLIGSAFDDALVGNAGSNMLNGGDGD